MPALSNDDHNSHKDLSDLKPGFKQALAITGGVALAYELIRHRHLVLSAIAAGGGVMVAKHFLDRAKERQSQSPARPLGAPSYPGETSYFASQRPEDEVEEASMESFPASDPPASYHRA